MIIFEKKGLVRILLFLFSNNYSINSKYMLKKAFQLSSNTLNECIEVLKERKLIETSKELDSRKRIEIKLTKLGITIAHSLEEIMSKLKN
ncbi:hypothetical protein LCGC14_0803040 [marine sediment metagenome]|uniref:HTH marR-type domain-containing protein n=1 Tax=marine sediment metagenome TaxID=412755 RepID=A0A0F9Q8W0_9ZZZZ